MSNAPLVYQQLITKAGQVGFCCLGQGQPLILIVGYSGTLYHWNRHFVYELAKYYTVYLIDNRNLGYSTSTNEYSMRGMAQDVADFIQALKLARPLLFGWSMGGIIAQTVLKYHSQLVSGAILLASVAHANYTSPAFVNLIANSAQLPAPEFRRQLYAMFFSETPRDELKDLITASALPIKDYNYRFNFTAKELQDYAIVTWSGMDPHDLGEVKVPVLLLHARDDLVVGSAAINFLAEHLSSAKLIVYPRGGHFFLHRAPVEVARDVFNCFS